MASSNPISAKDWYERGHQLKRAGDAASALEAFKHSIKLNPSVSAPWIGLAQLLEINNQLEEARMCLQRGVQAEPRSTVARRLLASSHQALGYVEEAKKEFDNALAIEPDSAPIHLGLGQLYEDIGEPVQAARAYREALELEPNKYDALPYLLGLSRHVDVKVEIDFAEAIMEKLELSERALVGYGLGKAYEQQKDYNKAFAAYDLANSSRRALSGVFSREALDARVQQMISIFTADFYSARKDWGDNSESPIFIVGLPRSGTTLTEQIISSHPQCFGAGELNTLTDLATGTPDRLATTNQCWPNTAEQLDSEQVKDIANEYLRMSSMRAPGYSLRVVDKQPLNFWHLGLIALALPNARIIHCERDIRDCGLSIFSHNFNLQQNWSTDLGDIAYYWKAYRKLMQHFQSVTDLRFLSVPYEETVGDLELSAKRLLAFIDLPWDENVLSFHKNERAVQTPSRWQVRQPVYKSSLARWQRYGEKLKPLIDAVEE